jgi:predicted DNA-binding protein
VSNARTSLRLPDGLLSRLEAIAKAQGISISAAMRIALQRGIAAIEREAEPAEAPRRKVFSRGVE